MGMPKYLSAKFFAEQSKMAPADIALHAICAGADYGALIFDVLNNKSQVGKRAQLNHVLWCFIRARWFDLEMRRYRVCGGDDMERVPSRLYVGLLERGVGVFVAEFREVSVPRYCVDRLEKSNREREELDRQQAKLASTIASLRSKVYASRCFPPHLKAVIFQRDGYRCRTCLRDRQSLEKAGLHLEVDHIMAFVDGGKTTYSNGVTLCNECNTAKHHIKGYLDALAKLTVPSGIPGRAVSESQ